MKKIVHDLLKEELYYDKLENGLELFYMPKKGFSKQYAVFSTRYGSNDLEFIPVGQKERIRVNEGIAHFLEHKVFEQPDGTNAFDKFSKYGASANAYTNFTTTSYLFSSTDNFYDSLAHLVDYVQHPHFTDENVEKEKGIIAQEIKMYDDNPDWKVYFNTLKAMYIKHPINIDIAGTVESIYKITKEELYDCYNTFYNPYNMSIFVVGDLDFDKIKETVINNLRTDIPVIENIERFYPVEPDGVNMKEIVETLDVSLPLFNIGFKDLQIGLSGRELLKREITTDLIIDMLFKKGSEFYKELYNANLVNDSFSGDYTGRYDHGYTLIGGESKDPYEVKSRLFDYIEKIKEDGFKEEQFEIIKKRYLGGYLKYFDSLDFIANNFISYHFKDINLLDYIDVVKEITIDDIQSRFAEHFTKDNSVISIVNPKE